MLDQDVLADHAQIGRAVLDIGGHVGRTDYQQVHPGVLGRQAQQARGIAHRGNAHRVEQRQAVLQDAALGQGQGQAGRAGGHGTRILL